MVYIPNTVTNPGSNRARRGLTSFMRRKLLLPTTPPDQPIGGIYPQVSERRRLHELHVEVAGRRVSAGGVCTVQLVRLLFWNRHSTAQRVELDVQHAAPPAADSTPSAAAVNAAFTAADDDATVSSPPPVHQPHGLSVCLSVCLSVIVAPLQQPSLSFQRILSVKCFNTLTFTYGSVAVASRLEVADILFIPHTTPYP